MGKSQKPLVIIALPPIDEWEEIQALREQGHLINPGLMTQADVILGPHCWRMDEEHRQYLDLAIKEARKIRYPNKGGER